MLHTKVVPPKTVKFTGSPWQTNNELGVIVETTSGNSVTVAGSNVVLKEHPLLAVTNTV